MRQITSETAAHFKRCAVLSRSFGTFETLVSHLSRTCLITCLMYIQPNYILHKESEFAANRPILLKSATARLKTFRSPADITFPPSSLGGIKP